MSIQTPSPHHDNLMFLLANLLSNTQFYQYSNQDLSFCCLKVLFLATKRRHFSSFFTGLVGGPFCVHSPSAPVPLSSRYTRILLCFAFIDRYFFDIPTYLSKNINNSYDHIPIKKVMINFFSFKVFEKSVKISTFAQQVIPQRTRIL